MTTYHQGGVPATNSRATWVSECGHHAAGVAGGWWFGPCKKAPPRGAGERPAVVPRGVFSSTAEAALTYARDGLLVHPRRRPLRALA